MRFSAFLAALAFPVLEIALLIKVGGLIGIWAVLLIIVATGALGVIVIRGQGLASARRLAEAIELGKSPATPALEAIITVLAGMLLIAPGLITDALGLLLLVKPIRAAAARWLSVHAVDLATEFPRGAGPERSGEAGAGTIIEGEFVRLEERERAIPTKLPPHRAP